MEDNTLNNNEITCQEYIASNKRFMLWIIVYSVVLYFIFTVNENYKQRVNDLLLSFNQGKEIRCKDDIVSLSNGFVLSKDQQTVSNGQKIYGLDFCRKLEEK